jgi:hypothetical protein
LMPFVAVAITFNRSTITLSRSLSILCRHSSLSRNNHSRTTTASVTFNMSTTKDRKPANTSNQSSSVNIGELVSVAIDAATKAGRNERRHTRGGHRETLTSFSCVVVVSCVR